MLSKYLPSDEPLFRIRGDDAELVNPRFMLERPNEMPWAFGDSTCWENRYGHGDFHVGNILVDLGNGTCPARAVNIFVLDFDYVGPYCCYYDVAQLETSLLMAIALTEWPAAEQDSVWRNRLRPLLYALDEQALPDDANKSWVNGVYTAVKKFRLQSSESERPFYDAALAATMLRIFTSHHRKEPQDLPPASVRFGLGYLGRVLRRLVKVDNWNKNVCQEVSV